MKRSIILSLLFLPLFLNAQFKLTGNVKSETEAIAWANVVLLSEDEKIISGGITDENGSFTLNAESGTYNLVISFLGFEDFKKDINLQLNVDLGEIILKEAANALDEVVVSYTKKLIDQKPDRIVFNIENNITAAGGDALDALKIAPGLRVDDNGISMLGRGNSQVMINGRIFPLSGAELVGYLNSISADDIKKIEVITNPPAKYEASGNGGLINIVLKKGVQNSWKNTTSAIQNINTHSFLTLRNSLLYNKNKWNVSFSLDKTDGSLRGLEDFQVYYPESTWDIDITTKDNEDAFSGRLLLDYEVSDRSTVGVQYLGNNRQPDIRDRSISNIFNASNTLDSLLINDGNSLQDINSHLVNLHTITALDTLGRKLSFDVDYFYYDSNQERNFRTESFSPNMEFLNVNAAAITTSNQSIENFTFKGDMEHPFDFLNLSYGFLVSSTKSKSDIENFNTDSGAPELDVNTSNIFSYMENNQAIYVNGSKKINEKWNLQLGLRAENTQTEGFSENLNQTNKNNYLKIFPTAYMSYEKNENNSMTFSYGKRIRRPSYRNLNPFRVYVSSNTFSEGNPFLQPSFTDVFEFKHTFKNKLTTNIFFNRTVDASGIIFTSDIENQTQIVTRENFYDQNTYGFGESYLFNTLNWLQSQNSFNLVNIQTKFIKPINAIPQNGFSYSLSSNNTITLNDVTKLQLDMRYDSFAKSDLFTLGEMWSVDLGLSKSFFNKNLKASVFVKDIFNTSSLNNLASTVNGVRQVYGQNRNNRFIRVSLSYSFGNQKVNVNERGFGNEEERRRTN
ncbi:TonB-dependent receptor domain-containing protein [Maribacter aestuarii]|uniref:TonB-dependent receptor domain-containing protein n=1 Tax=Maribacter aestuarii TaxID=1130723 RepID=UPI00248BB05A|nr:TonB-dependent receptor [Maribacter aestuarii]